jgi:fructokinase
MPTMPTIDPAPEVVCFGEALVDFFPPVPGVPLVDCEVFHRHLGGAPANVAVGLARLGVRTGLMTLVGPDEFGDFLRSRLQHRGVDVRGIGTHRSAKTGVTFVSVALDGARRFLFFRHPSADQLIAVEDVEAHRALVAGARVLHVGSSTLAREPARAATWAAIELHRGGRHGILSADPNWRPHLWDDPADAPAMVRQLIARADVVKISDDELEPLVGATGAEEGARALHTQGCPLVVVTLGAEGAYFLCDAGDGHLPGLRVPVIDTTGAGDAFMAGLLAGLIEGLGETREIRDLPADAIARACERGNRLGAACVGRLGATSYVDVL